MRYTKRLALLLVFLLSIKTGFSQNVVFAQQIIDTLSSESFHGRGYVNKGDLLAAKYIAGYYKSFGLDPFDDNYFQDFELDVNTVTNAAVKVNGEELVPGYDYLVSPSSPTYSGSYKVKKLNHKRLNNGKKKQLSKTIAKGKAPLVNSTLLSKESNRSLYAISYKEAPVVKVNKGLTYSVARNQSEGVQVWLNEESFSRRVKHIDLSIKSELIKDYKSQNVIGIVNGTKYPDSLIVICGHYDHLGKMGNATFYGANDNASGIAMMLDMAKYFSENPMKYSIAFIAFGGEEAGLVGSKHYVYNPTASFPLSKTKFVFNMDLMGSGEAGATIVNSTVYPDYFKRLEQINDEKGYLTRLKKRGKAANSDHYFFSENGVPSFFIYLMGDYKHYHVPSDNAQNLKLDSNYNNAFKLIRDFIIELNK